MLIAYFESAFKLTRWHCGAFLSLSSFLIQPDKRKIHLSYVGGEIETPVGRAR
jgi:hypothetical protein